MEKLGDGGECKKTFETAKSGTIKVQRKINKNLIKIICSDLS